MKEIATISVCVSNLQLVGLKSGVHFISMNKFTKEFAGVA